MDAAKVPMGHGRPFGTGLWSGDFAHAPEAKRRAGCRGRRFWLLLSLNKSNSPEKGETLSQALTPFASSPANIQSPLLQPIKNAAEAALRC